MKDYGQWLLPGQTLPDTEQIKDFYVKGSQWQLYTTVSGGYALVVSEKLYEQWLQKNLVEEGLLLELGGTGYVLTVPAGELISSVEHGPFPRDLIQVKAFARALKTSLEQSDASPADGIYISRFSRVLPTFCDKRAGDADWILGSWISGGMRICLRDTERIRKYAPFLSEDVRLSLLEMFDIPPRQPEGDGTILQMPSPIDPGWDESRPGMKRAGNGTEGKHLERKERKEGPFSLPGRPKMEKFFREEILDVIDREEEYSRFGVHFPGATLFYGPPGSGKTFAVEKLAEYLGWPVIQVNSGTIGSTYLHETSRKISEVFDLAITEAPSILIIDELEAFLSSRQDARGSYQFHMEEVGEFLRRIPDTAKNHVLLFGMTNMPESIDQAILRKGRFDHIMEVDMPSAVEILAVLENALAALPTQGELHLPRLADQLAGRPFSDVTYVVNEAGRISVREKKKGIDSGALEEALRLLAPEAVKPTRKIGFV